MKIRKSYSLGILILMSASVYSFSNTQLSSVLTQNFIYSGNKSLSVSANGLYAGKDLKHTITIPALSESMMTFHG